MMQPTHWYSRMYAYTNTPATIVLLLLFACNGSFAYQTPAKQTTVYSSADTVNLVPACTQHPQSTQAQYRHNIIMTRFARRDPSFSSAGMLHDAEHGLPNLISFTLQQKYHLDTRAQLPYAALPVNQIGEQGATQFAHELTQKLQSQYFVSGEITDMSMQRPEATYNPNLWQSTKNIAFDFLHLRKNLDSRKRHFAFSINIREGTTGQTIFARNYHTSGVWKIRTPTEVGFNSTRFWRSHYGKNIRAIVDRASGDIARAIHCQPFIVAIDTMPEDNMIKLKSGANNGLAVGDTLELFQVLVRANTEYQSYNTHLIKNNTQITLQAVYPNYSIAILDSTTVLNGRYVGIVLPQQPPG